MKRVDVIKSHELDRKVMSMALEKRGYAVRLFDNPATYLELAGDEASADCIVTGIWFDISPGGVTLAREIARRHPGLPVIVVSMMAEYEQNAMDSGAFAFLDHSPDHEYRELTDLISKATECRCSPG